MKRSLVLLMLTAGLVVAEKPDFAIAWYSVGGGGGGRSGDDKFMVSGVISQGDKDGPLFSGDEVYRLAGGFWMLATGETAPPPPSGPRLELIVPRPGVVRVQWASGLTGYVLQKSARLGADTWSDTDLVLEDDGVHQFILIETPSEHLFFRLRKITK